MSNKSVNFTKLINSELKRGASRFEYHNKKDRKSFGEPYHTSLETSFEANLLERMNVDIYLGKIREREAEILRLLFIEDGTIKKFALGKKYINTGAHK